MDLSENRQHDILLVAASLLFIIFASGLAPKSKTPASIVIPPP